MTTKYLVCTFSFEGGKLPDEFYVVDRSAKKIFMYQFYRDCKDETKRLQRMWETEQKRPFNRKLGCELIEVLNGEEPDGFLKTILATDDARKVINKVCEFRAKWFAIRLRRLEHLATSESGGWAESAEDSFIAKDFINL